MQILNLTTPGSKSKFSVYELGFRPFFLCAGLFAVLSILVWLLVYTAQIQLPSSPVSSYQWHAHEMIYGYSVAVIAGFLLTATKNWTGVQTLHGTPLLLLMCLWISARLAIFAGEILIATVLDSLFTLWLLQAIVTPIVKAKQWTHLTIVVKLLSLFVTNLLFYLGALGIVENGIHWGIYGGLYLVIGLILMMARRVVPFFIERGVGYPVTLKNSKFLDLSSLAFFLVFFILVLTQTAEMLTAYTALALFLINAARLIGWHTLGIWKKPLLWSLYLAIWFICIGFLLYALTYFTGISKYLAIHAFSYAGIGAITIGMMSRVALGHSGRDVSNPPKAIGVAFAILMLGAVVRVFFPLIAPVHYIHWITISQGLWIVAFLIFSFVYLPILTKSAD